MGIRSVVTASNSIRGIEGNRRMVGKSSPSGVSCRTPTTPRDGRAATSDRRSPNDPSRISVSGFRKRTYGARSGLERAVVRVPEPVVLADHDPGRRELTLHELPGPVGGAVVGHDDVELEAAGTLEYRPETGGEPISPRSSRRR